MFTPAVLDHVVNPRNVGPLEGATHAGVAGVPGDGPYVEMWLEVEDGHVRRAAYRTFGCPACIACASLTAQLATGRALETLTRLEPADLVTLLGGIPPAKSYCPTLAVEALHKALCRGLTQDGEEG